MLVPTNRRVGNLSHSFIESRSLGVFKILMSYSSCFPSEIPKHYPKHLRETCLFVFFSFHYSCLSALHIPHIRKTRCWVENSGKSKKGKSKRANEINNKIIYEAFRIFDFSVSGSSRKISTFRQHNHPHNRRHIRIEMLKRK